MKHPAHYWMNIEFAFFLYPRFGWMKIADNRWHLYKIHLGFFGIEVTFFH